MRGDHQIYLGLVGNLHRHEAIQKTEIGKLPDARWDCSIQSDVAESSDRSEMDRILGTFISFFDYNALCLKKKTVHTVR